MRFLLFALLAVAALHAADPPPPATGGPDGTPISILVVGHDMDVDPETGHYSNVDPQYRAELEAAGYRVAAMSWLDTLTAAYLKSFSVVILTRLPPMGWEYSVGGWRMAPFQPNMALLHDYVAAGGGLIVEPLVGGGGEGVLTRYNRFLEPYDVKYRVAQLYHPAEAVNEYAPGQFVGKDPLVAGLQSILYPTNVLRWDDAYSTTPFRCGAGWTILAEGKSGSGMYRAVSNKNLEDRAIGDDRALVAIRQAGKGRVVVSAIASYYTLTHAYREVEQLGENHVGMLAGTVMKGRDGRPSQGAEVFDRIYRNLAANSTANGIGGAAVPAPEQPPPPDTTRVIDWTTRQPPPTWAHRVIPIRKDDQTYYDEQPDPAVTGPVQYFKILVGPRTALSSGSGTVGEYRRACEAAGYRAVVFAETFAELDPQRWQYLVQACKDNTDDTFVCLPGLDIEDFSGQHYLIISPSRWLPDSWLTRDGKRLSGPHWLSLGLWGHMTVIHRGGRGPLDPRTFKHYSGITVATYDGDGKQVDDAFYAYQWSVSTDSNGLPLAVHELTSPDQVAKAAVSGYQQIVPADTLADGMDYFHFGMQHYFECPGRYFISEGPILDGWSIFNKDIGPAAENRDHWRLGIGVRGDAPIVEATLFDGFDIARRWYPGQPEFKTTLDGFHSMQHQFLLLARDQQGRRVLSPGIRTVPRNYRCRCGDRQNWLGSLYIYTGTPFLEYGGFDMPLRTTDETGSYWWHRDKGPNPANTYEYPFFSNHVEVMEADNSGKYWNTAMLDIIYDAKPMHPIRPTDWATARTRLTYFTPVKQKDFTPIVVDQTLGLKRTAEPDRSRGVWPTVFEGLGYNQSRNLAGLLILPDRAPEPMGLVYDVDKRRYVGGNKENMVVDLPVGAYAGACVPLTPGLRLNGRRIGFPLPPATQLTFPAGSEWHARFLVLRSNDRAIGKAGNAWDMDKYAETALRQMGFRGDPPYRFALDRGKVASIAYTVTLTAAEGGVGGRLENPTAEALLYFLPVLVTGLSPRVDAALWRADTARLEYFATFEDKHYVMLDADKTVDLFLGNVAHTDPALVVSTAIWNADTAWFRVHNPTPAAITAEFRTEPGFRGYRQLTRQITVPPGSSIEVRSE